MFIKKTLQNVVSNKQKRAQFFWDFMSANNAI